MNWGKKITLVYLGFVALMITMVTLALNQRLDLVTDDYYKQELDYQNKINSMVATNQLSERPKIIQSEDKIVITFPEEFTNKKIEGNINLYCPSDARKDKNFEFNIDKNIHEINIKTISKTRYVVQIAFKSDNTNYYTEETINLK